MIQVSNLNKGYAHQDILTNVSFTIHKGDKIGLVGRNGHGKTTLFRMLAGLESTDTGVIQFPKDYKIAYLKQEMNFKHQTVLEEVLSAISDDEIKEEWKAEKILSGLDFTEDMMHSSPSILSGGWMNRINLAKVLISDADLLLLDEPTNHLDIITIHWLTKFLQSWRKELILITHDRAFMDAIVTHTMIIHRKQVRKITGTTQKIYDQIAQEEEIYEKTRLNDAKERERVEQFIRKFRAKARLAGMVQSRIKSLDKKDNKDKLDHLVDLDFEFQFKSFDTRNMMTIDSVAFGYEKNHLLFHDISFDLAKGDRIAIIGKNGKGKSTLLRVVANQLDPLSGSVKYHPQLITGYYGQVAEQELNPSHTVEEEIASVLPSGSREKARAIAGAMMFEGHMALKKCEVLSGGEKARVLLGKLIASPCHALLLDEPTNHLDMQSVDSLVEALDAFEGALIMVTHNEMILNMLANKLIVFDGDEPYIFLGTYQEFLQDKGFIDEEVAKPKKNQVKLSKEEKKEQQRRKQELQKELKLYQNSLDDIEIQIYNAENRVKQIQEELVQASTDNNGNLLASLGKELSETNILIEELFNILEEKHSLIEDFKKQHEL